MPHRAKFTSALRQCLAVFVATALVMATAASAETATIIDALHAHESARDERLLLIDIRSPGEWRASGVPEHAITITVHQPDGPEVFFRKVLAAANGDENRPLALICASGGRSHIASRFLSRKGLTAVHDVSEGLFGGPGGPGWIRRGLPVNACSDC